MVCGWALLLSRFSTSLSLLLLLVWVIFLEDQGILLPCLDNYLWHSNVRTETWKNGFVAPGNILRPCYLVVIMFGQGPRQHHRLIYGRNGSHVPGYNVHHKWVTFTSSAPTRWPIWAPYTIQKLNSFRGPYLS